MVEHTKGRQQTFTADQAAVASRIATPMSRIERDKGEYLP
jgi:hypothetical protein